MGLKVDEERRKDWQGLIENFDWPKIMEIIER